MASAGAGAPSAAARRTPELVPESALGGPQLLVDLGLIDAPPLQSLEAGDNSGIRDGRSVRRPDPGASAGDTALPSLDAIESMVATDAADSDARAVEADVDALQHVADYGDLLREGVFERHTAALDRVKRYVQSVLDHKRAIASDLQKPFAERAIAVEPEHQREFVNLLNSMPATILAQPTLTEDIDWLRRSGLDERAIGVPVERASRLLARYQRCFEALQELRAELRRLHSVRADRADLGASRTLGGSTIAV